VQGGQGTAAPVFGVLPQTEVDHVQGTLGTKEVLLSFRGRYSSTRGAPTHSILKSKDLGVLITVTTEKECRSKEIYVELSRNKHKQGIRSGLNQQPLTQRGGS